MRVYTAEEATSYNLVATIFKDFDTAGTAYNIDLVTASGSVYGTAVYGTDVYGGDTIVTKRIETNLSGDFFQIKFSNSNADEPFEVFGFQLYIERVDRF